MFTSFFSYYRPYKHLFILDFSCAVVAALYFNVKMTKTYRGLFSALADFKSRVEENIGGIRVVQAFVNEGHEQKLFEENNNAYRATSFGLTKSWPAACPSITCQFGHLNALKQRRPQKLLRGACGLIRFRINANKHSSPGIDKPETPSVHKVSWLGGC